MDLIFGTGIDSFRKRDRIREVLGSFKRLLKGEIIKVKIKEKDCIVLGRIGMYHCVIDVSNLDVKIGDEVFIDTKLLYIDKSIRREYI